MMDVLTTLTLREILIIGIVGGVILLALGIIIGCLFAKEPDSGGYNKEFPADFPNAHWSDAPDERK